MRPLKILVVLPMYGGSLPVGRYCVEALRDLGHMAEPFEAPAFHSAFTALKGLGVTADRLESLEASFLNVVSQAIMAKVETLEPDLVLALAQAPLSRNILARLRKEGIATAMWFVEDYRVFTYWRAFAPFYDFFAVIQKEPFLSQLAEAGQPNAIYLPMAALPSFHAPTELSPAERRTFGSDVSFMGAGYPNRRVAFRALMHLDFKIWGTEWEGEPMLSPFVQRGGQRISPDEALKIYEASKINLNLHSSVQSRELVPRGDFVNPRTFELAAMGAFQLVDKRDLMAELFGPDDLATFENMAELQEKIAWFLSRPEEREKVTRNGRKRVLSEHTYQHRMAALLDFIKQKRPGWPKEREEGAFPIDMPEGLRRETAALMASMGLPSNASLLDVIDRLRRKSGELTPLEASLLFMDEWRKQYVKN